jgi:hypothetical protein
MLVEPLLFFFAPHVHIFFFTAYGISQSCLLNKKENKSLDRISLHYETFYLPHYETSCTMHGQPDKSRVVYVLYTVEYVGCWLDSLSSTVN